MDFVKSRLSTFGKGLFSNEGANSDKRDMQPTKPVVPLDAGALHLFHNCIEGNSIVITHVATFASPFEAEDMRRVNQDWRKIIKPVLFVHKIQCGQWSQPGPSNDHEMPFFFDLNKRSELTRHGNQTAYNSGRLTPDNDRGPDLWEDASTKGIVHLKNLRAIEIRAKVSSWKDQGWGNRKSRLFVRLARQCLETGKYRTVQTLDLFGIAQHTPSSAQVTMGRQHGNLAFFDAMQDGDSLHLFRYVGNGAHSLQVHDLEVEFILASASV